MIRAAVHSSLILAAVVGTADAARPALTDEATFGSGQILVHYATTGGDAPPTDDANSNGVPDFVEQVATTTDTALTDLIALGFRRPVDDGVIGGDGRIDIYLRNLQSADGSTSVDTCTQAACAGYAVVENDFAGYSYSSRTEAIRSVAPHELFHLIQYAYTTEQQVTWSEGTAVWAVERLYGQDNSDFERFLPGFISKTFRPFERASSGFGDSYPYGAALWPLYLDAVYGVPFLVDVFERTADQTFLRAIDAALVERGGSLDAAWAEFTRWNSATGGHAVSGGYAAAAGWPEAPREPLVSGDTTLYVEGRSARYAPVQVAERSELLVMPTKGIRVAAWAVPVGAPLGEGIALEGDDVALAAVLEPGNYSLVLSGMSEGTITTAVDLALVPPSSDEDDGGGCSSTPGASVGFAIVLAILLVRRRRTALTLGTLLASTIASAQAPDAPEPATPGKTDEELEAEAAAQGEVIVITGTRSETPRAASPVTTEVIDRQRILESGVQTVSDALSLRPGIWIDRGINGDQGVSLQGLSPQYTLILIDGARQIGRTDGVLDLDRFGIENIERIEIVRGPSSVLYGSDALGGVINLVSRKPKHGVAADALLRIDSRLSREARGRVAFGEGKWGGSIFGSYKDADPVRIDNDGTRLATSIDAYKDSHVTGQFVHRHSDELRTDAMVDYVQRDLRGIDTQTTGAVFDRRNLVETASAAIATTYSGEKTAVRAEVDGSIYRDQYLLDQRNSTALDQYQITDETLVEGRVTAAHQLTTHHRGLVGAEVLHETLESPRLDSSGTRTRAAVFVQDEWKLGKDFDTLIVPAARLDYDTQFGTNATPRLAARHTLGDGNVVRASVGMGYRAPSFKELLLLFSNPGAGYIVEGNPDLSPETSFSAQLGGEWKASKWLYLAGDMYWNELKDMILAVTADDTNPDMLRFSYDNIGRARTRGGELYATATRGRAALELGYALNLTRDLDLDRALEGLPRHRFTATARWRDKAQRFDGFLAAVITGGRPFYRDANDPQMASYSDRRFELRARVGKRFANGFGAFVGIDNILDAGNDSLDRIQPRTMYVGMEAHIE